MAETEARELGRAAGQATPPSPAADPRTNNLPVELTAFIGRDAEIDLGCRLLGETRLLTLTGAGGCGKTRLALRIAAERLDDHLDGVWWVDLAPLADPALVPAAVVAALGQREMMGEPLVETVARHLASRSCLLVLDNCEHLVAGAAALVERVLRDCPATSVLTTSREPLGVGGETTWRVPSLSLPASATPTVDAVTRCEAVRLFIDRSIHARPNFRVTNENAAAVAEICMRLDGIPLAIELAAARTRMMTPAQIVDGLHDRFHLLTGGARSALPRQRTLEASVDWSHDLLDGAERTVFRRLGAFSGSFTLDAAEAVCGGDGIERQAVLDLVSRLVDRSLVQIDEEGRVARYRLLETIRDYARRKLVDSGDAEAVHDRHLDFYIEVAEQAAPQLFGPEMSAWLAKLDDELDNMRAAMDWSLHVSHADRGLRLAEQLHWFWRARSPTEGRARLEAALARSTSDCAHKGRALTALCSVAMMAGDTTYAQRCGEDAVDLGRQVGDDQVVGMALSLLGWLAWSIEPDPTIAPALLDESIAAARTAGDDVIVTLSLNALGFSCIGTGEPHRARGLLEEGMSLARAIAYERPQVEGELWTGWLDMFEGRFADAAAHLNRALDVPEWHWDAFFQALGRSILGEVRIAQGHYDDAREQFQLGLAVALEHRTPFGEAEVRHGLAWLDYAVGDLAAATAEIDRASGPLRAMAIREAARCTALHAHVELASQPETARVLVDEARSLGRALNYHPALLLAMGADAALTRFDNEPDKAEDTFHDLLDGSLRASHATGACDALEGLAGAVADLGRFEEAARLLGAAETLRNALGYARYPVRRARYEHDVGVVRTGLGETRFDTAWSEGAALSIDDAVAYARRGRGERKRPAHGWNSLTPTERQIVALVADGLTNPQIGERMFVSRRTVQTHLRHVFAKLGVATRAQLAAKATLHGVD